jgi:hypothetical protein
MSGAIPPLPQYAFRDNFTFTFYYSDKDNVFSNNTVVYRRYESSQLKIILKLGIP